VTDLSLSLLSVPQTMFEKSKISSLEKKKSRDFEIPPPPSPPRSGTSKGIGCQPRVSSDSWRFWEPGGLANTRERVADVPNTHTDHLRSIPDGLATLHFTNSKKKRTPKTSKIAPHRVPTQRYGRRNRSRSGHGEIMGGGRKCEIFRK
jgi:hypothetical protein